MISSNSLKLTDRDGRVDRHTPTALFTGMGTYSAKDPGKRQIPHDNFDGFPVLSFLHHLYIALHIQIGRAGLSAGRRIQLLDCKTARNGLGIGFECGLTIRQPHIIFAGSGYRADLGTVSASRACVIVNVSRTFAQIYLKVTLFSINVFDVGAGVQLNVDMPADLDQFGRDNSHGTIIGGKSLVQLGHNPADGRRFFNQMNKKAGIR